MPWSRTAKQPGDFTRLLQALAEHDMREMASSFVLRSQAQAVYSPRNIGHFGLNLKRYAHFTSPIRRYSDLVVHRALIRKLGLGKDGLAPDVGDAQLASLGEHLSRTERKAMEAERRAFERLMALFLADRVGTVFPARVTTVVYFGLFVTLDETGADGLVPVSTLGDDAFQLDERHQALVGQRTGETFALGDRVKVELVEADPVQGTLLFRLDAHEPGKGAVLARAAWKKGGPRKVAGPRPPARALAPPPLLTADAPTAAGMARPRADHAHRHAGRHDLLAGVAAPLAGAGARRASTRSAIGLNTAAGGLGIFLVAPFVPRLVRAPRRGRLLPARAGRRPPPACWSSRSGSTPGSGSPCGCCSAWPAP